MTTSHSARMRVLRVFVASLLLALAATASAQQDSTTVRPPDALPAAVIGGTIGSAVGLLGLGFYGAHAECDAAPGDYCGIAGGALGGMVGGTIGAAVGAYLGASFRDADPSITRTLIASTGGLLTGAGVGIVLGQLAGTPGFVLGFAFGQGALAGLAAARWR